jgi:hypothetical protein
MALTRAAFLAVPFLVELLRDARERAIERESGLPRSFVCDDGRMTAEHEADTAAGLTARGLLEMDGTSLDQIERLTECAPQLRAQRRHFEIELGVDGDQILVDRWQTRGGWWHGPSHVHVVGLAALVRAWQVQRSMQVLVRHDDTIRGSEELSAMTTATVEDVLSRFAAHITTVEVHFADENGAKGGGGDVRCSLEVRFEGRPPTGVTNHSGDLIIALEGAAEMMARSLEHQLGRIRANTTQAQ